MGRGAYDSTLLNCENSAAAEVLDLNQAKKAEAAENDKAAEAYLNEIRQSRRTAAASKAAKGAAQTDTRVSEGESATTKK